MNLGSLSAHYSTVEALVADFKKHGGSIGSVPALLATSFILNLDATPELTNWAKGVHEHIKGGKVDMSKVKFSVYFTVAQKAGGSTRGWDVLKEVRGMKVADAHMARWIQDNPKALSEEIRKHGVLHCPFTTFSGRNGSVYDLSLGCRGDEVVLGRNCLDDDWWSPVLLWQVEDTEPQLEPVAESSEP